MALGTKASLKAVAAWLTDKVGVGGTFTMLELRDAVPDANQVDRRMRDLRQMTEPWRIVSGQSDPSLPLNRYRLDLIGNMIAAKKPSAKVRRKVFEAAGNRCTVCGVGLGEEYVEYPGETARLQLGHYIPLDLGGAPTVESNLRAECHRCNGGVRHLMGSVPTAASLEARAKVMGRAKRADLVRWLDQGQRDVEETERLFYQLRQLPASARAEVIEALRKTL